MLCDVQVAELLSVAVFWCLTPCGLVNCYWRFEGSWCL